MRFLIFVPIYNPGKDIYEFFGRISCQNVKPRDVLVVDSSSTDVYSEILKKNAGIYRQINMKEYDHGSTRNFALDELYEYEVIVFLTQDAFLANSQSLSNLIYCFENSEVGAAYGRQLPRYCASHIEAHARLFNYPPHSFIKSKNEKEKFGIKSVFISNSFAAYRVSALKEVGCFPEGNIVSEDTYVAAKMILAGWKIAYCAEAQVYHSHAYNFWQEFQRYFDIGVFHAREPWVRESFGGAEGEGWRFVRSEMKYLAKNAPWFIPSALVRTPIRYLGFRTGLLEKFLSVGLKRKLSMQKAFWDREKSKDGYA